MTRETIKSVVRHSALTALALDAVGDVFVDYTPKDRAAWYKGDRLTFPENYNGSSSFNSEFLAIVLLSLFETNAKSLKDFPRASSELIKVLDSYGKRKATFVQKMLNKYYAYCNNTGMRDGLLIPVAVAIAYYSAVNELPSTSFFSLCEALFSLFLVEQEEYEAALFLSFILYRLVNTGYFGYESLEETETFCLATGEFSVLIAYFMENHLDAEFLTKFDDEWIADFSYSQCVVVYVVFYMLRVATAYPKEILKSLPREQIPEIFTSCNGVLESDMGFVFGAVCTASEHKHPLVPKPLRESVYFRDVIDSAITVAHK
jgi:hypothetical protein